ncbi:hypothetical protein SASPL_106549 [Salvia splendens]|uniref:Amino acid transporter transmembrane domain-containing protein n=1 Tax=Salvia splendens TaxID=180675 RepID=A0A8X8YNI6_SALSN|nr:hypothetical protein SASPL_106549 [Salvia splendens]
MAEENPETPTTAKDVQHQTSKGSWAHAAFHVATTIATPAAYAPLPFAVASLGWPLGVVSLVGGTLSTWYSSLLIASLWRWDGNSHTTYTLLAKSIYGSWGYWSIAFFQQVASLGNNIAIQIAAGSSLKAVYKHYDPDGGLKLQHFIVFFGGFELALSQFPDIHSLRWLNALCTLSTIGFATTVIGVTVYSGNRGDRSMVTYGLEGSSSDKVFRRFSALGAIAFSFGDAMLPEIQSTVREPVKANMYKGVSSAYSVIAVTYWQIAFLGYWAFGADVEPYIVASLTTPQWTLVVANLFAFVQILGCYQIYCRPTYAYFEGRVAAAKNSRLRGCVHRLVYTFVYIALITLVSSAMPFFGDFVSICGAVGFTPLDFVFPVVAYMKAGKMPRSRKLRLPLLLFNTGIAVWFSIVAVLGCVGAVRYIIQDTRTYSFFHDM